jgi:hypothetical protein
MQQHIESAAARWLTIRISPEAMLALSMNRREIYMGNSIAGDKHRRVVILYFETEI